MVVRAIWLLWIALFGLRYYSLAQDEDFQRSERPRVVGSSQLTSILSSGFTSSKEGANSAARQTKYRVLATKKTSTMQKELNEAAVEGFKFEGVMGGNTAWGGSETVVVVSRDMESQGKVNYEYKLLATSRTSTMQKEMQEAAEVGYEYKGQTVFETTFGGKEVVVIMERDRDVRTRKHDYRLLATSKTSTMQKELLAAGEAGFEFVGMAVAETAFGGNEVLTILRRPVAKK